MCYLWPEKRREQNSSNDRKDTKLIAWVRCTLFHIEPVFCVWISIACLRPALRVIRTRGVPTYNQHGIHESVGWGDGDEAEERGAGSQIP